MRINQLLNYLNREVLIIGGTLLAALAVNGFLLPHKLLSGGISGVSIILQQLTGFPAGLSVFLLNVPIFILGYKKIDRDFVIFSLMGMGLFSAFLLLTKNISRSIVLDDTMLAAIFGGVINGIGLGLVFRSRASMGGSDILAVVIRKKSSINMGTILFAFNFVIVLSGSLLFGLKPALFTLISMYLSAVLLDRVQEGFDRKKSALIITSEPEKISQAIMQEVHRGVTIFFGEGAFTHHNRHILYTVVTTRQLAKLKAIVESLDPGAFMTVSDTAEVLGKGFHRTAL
ncbi:YitT family protein [Zhaonella formicivorans]|jgi:uncharacterized membrane-anchored protein YitT (DUF2179 family)|uniref:YitT family protein n=1 Tax=Zhaonella formicivorans TaxID=2528593 RepID=UPI0010D1EA1B|nr:YitT family protein [Zhaonella formicivorans]